MVIGFPSKCLSSPNVSHWISPWSLAFLVRCCSFQNVLHWSSLPFWNLYCVVVLQKLVTFHFQTMFEFHVKYLSTPNLSHWMFFVWGFLSQCLSYPNVSHCISLGFRMSYYVFVSPKLATLFFVFCDFLVSVFPPQMCYIACA